MNSTSSHYSKCNQLLPCEELAGSYVVHNYSNTYTHTPDITCSTVGISCSKSDRATTVRDAGTIWPVI